MQSTFHGPLAYELVYPLPPIFTRMRPPTAAEAEDGLSLRKERSFYRNTYSMVRVRSCHIYSRSIPPYIPRRIHVLNVIFLPCFRRFWGL